ncbi:hypothetical protein SLA2020_280040 [Shorea laevis]
MASVMTIFRSFIWLWFMAHYARAGFLSEPASPGGYLVPAYPVQTQTQTCRLDLSAELFGGVSEACGKNLDRSRCCPVLAAWLFAAHARTALQVSAASPEPAPESDLPMMPDDSQRCVNALQTSLLRPWHSDSAAERELRRYSLLLRDSAPPDQLAQLPWRFQRYGAPQCDSHGFRQEFGEELPEFFLLWLYQVSWGSSKGTAQGWVQKRNGGQAHN